MDDGKAGGLTGVFQRLMDSETTAATASDPADLGICHGLEVRLNQRADAPQPPPPRPGLWSWLRRRGQTSTSRKGS